MTVTESSKKPIFTEEERAKIRERIGVRDYLTNFLKEHRQKNTGTVVKANTGVFINDQDLLVIDGQVQKTENPDKIRKLRRNLRKIH